MILEMGLMADDTFASVPISRLPKIKVKGSYLANKTQAI